MDTIIKYNRYFQKIHIFDIGIILLVFLSIFTNSNYISILSSILFGMLMIVAYRCKKSKLAKYSLALLSFVAYCITIKFTTGNYNLAVINIFFAITEYAFLVSDVISPVLVGAILTYLVAGNIHIQIINSNFRWIFSEVGAGSGMSIGIIVYMFSKCDKQRSDLEEANRALKYSSLHDYLTNLPNRIFLYEKLNEAIEKQKNNKAYNFAVVLMDLDRFKIVNDSLGHSNGDKLIIEIASRLRNSINNYGSVARFGGDEFGIIIDKFKSIDDIKSIMEVMVKDIKRPIDINGYKMITSASVGIVLGNEKYSSYEEYFRNADIAMYMAKAKGKDCYEFFDSSIEANILKKLKLENDLKYAVERNELCVFYQPVISLKNNQITGFEALIRWKHPEFGMIFPVEFIPIAEETGLIIPIGKWILYEACKQNSIWQSANKSDTALIMNVNISPLQLTQWDIVEEIKDVLEETSLPPQCLNVEITESALIKDINISKMVLQQIRELGISIHIDDFGTGYSSLKYLQQLPFDVVKVDRAFVQELNLNSKNKGVLKSIIMMAHELNMTVVGEGVETECQMEELKELGVERVQGYYFAKPMDSKSIEEILNKNLIIR